MDQSKQVDIASVLTTVAQQLNLNKNQLNQVDKTGTHGQRISDAFAAAAQAAQNSGTQDAGKQLEAAAQAMREQGQGKAVGFYAQGLEQAAGKFAGKSGISEASLGSFLQSFLGGVQQNNPAQPGQGTMIDALGPAVQAFQQSQQNGNTQQSMANALSAAISGTASTGNGGTVDPGAASVTNVLGGIFSALAPQLLAGLTGGGQGQAPSPGQVQGGLDLGGLLGSLTGGQSSQQSGQNSWVNGLLGGLMSNTGQGGGSQGAPDLGGLLGGLMGNQSPQPQGQGEQDLGGLLGGLMGNQSQVQGQGESGLGSLLGDMFGEGNNKG